MNAYAAPGAANASGVGVIPVGGGHRPPIIA